ncbi:2-hydroxyacid dehydrogenase [Pseudomonas putida]|uniref:Glyoxylate/hydroxypyruvate reductase A n=1 Tax=Pseudomonas putida TaxID=303 RepID=A0A7Z9EQ64_PSEPU|nr:glyoxylate/hydroxypyruvate reductase A [Pseudomonas putida]KAF0256180.1 glyoxylate/hydroxypyruvate reductase A [Pseudomonas putida]MCE0880645.1 glyoxylate/hydroxypyruvate reductase A [Pseudomonas putida]MCE0958823.1 glyoxylate/hydroxypyruvate reductase A [Pseudomonas putida]MCE0970907.1 glyoxylate/hydroxypyruvate reductase A [Pseudomonas putida]MDD2117099.1 glyoxylate/hydroxypyruvate reductase A [Pseudomonas putida]
MASLVLLCQNPALTDWLAALFTEHAPQLNVLRPEDAGARHAEVAVCWFPPQGSLGRLPNLRLVHSIGSGIDHLGQDSSRDASLPVCRVVDPDHTQGMSEYVHWGVLHFHRGFDRVIAGNASQHWQRPVQRKAGDFRVGVMGLGAIGAPVAQRLAAAGYDVRGWARTPRQVDGVNTFAGPASLQGFLAGLDVLVNLLPLTASTHGVLNHAVFRHMAEGSALINCGRGQHLNPHDLRQALASGQLRGALLDVFEQEPLPADSPLWHTPGVWVTPHMASAASDLCIARQVADNVSRLSAGLGLNNLVDPELGY